MGEIEVGGEGRNRTLTVASFEKRKSLTSTQILNDPKHINAFRIGNAILHYPRTILELSLQYPFTIRLLEVIDEVNRLKGVCSKRALQFLIL